MTYKVTADGQVEDEIQRVVGQGLPDSLIANIRAG